MAAKVQYTNQIVLNSRKGLKLISNFDYEYVQQKFKPLERLRLCRIFQGVGFAVGCENGNGKYYSGRYTIKKQKQ